MSYLKRKALMQQIEDHDIEQLKKILPHYDAVFLILPCCDSLSLQWISPCCAGISLPPTSLVL